MDKPSVTNRLLSRPKVLVLGNGILRACGGMDCGKLERLIYKASNAKPRHIRGTNISFPMRIAASFARSNDCHHGVENAIVDLFRQDKLGYQKTNMLLCHSKTSSSPFVKELLEAGFDDIITTNYGYEIEQVLLGRCPTLDAVNNKCDFYRRYKYAKRLSPKETKIPVEKKFKIRRCYRDPGTGTRVWHVHGEYLRPWSVIFGYYDYCSLLAKVKDQCSVEKFKARYGKYQKGEDFEPATSWVDSFLFGDVYILGFGAALDEPVFWWMMDRKKRMLWKTGKVYFYEPTFKGRTEDPNKKDVLTMIGAFGGEHRDLDVRILEPDPKSVGKKFSEFYEKACKEIIAEVRGVKESGDSSKGIVKRSASRS